MGSYTPPPPQPSDERSERPWWASPVLLGAIAVIIAGAAYKAGHHEALPVAPRVITDSFKVVEKPPMVVVVQGGPAVITPPTIPTPGPIPEPTQAEVRPVDRRSGVAVADPVQVTPTPDPAEAYWRARYAKLNRELTEALTELDAANRANPPVYNQNGGLLVIAEQQRLAAVSPYKVKVEKIQAQMDALPEECRLAGCQPGWIR